MFFSKTVVKNLRWTGNTRVLIQHGFDEHAGMTRLVPNNDGLGYALFVKNDGFMCASFQIPGLTCPSRRAEAISFSIEGQVLILIRPDWAAPDRMQRNTNHSADAVAEVLQGRWEAPLPAPQEPMPAPVVPDPREAIDAQDLDEALRMIAAGDTNVKIAEWLGWTPQKVQSLRVKRAA